MNSFESLEKGTKASRLLAKKMSATMAGEDMAVCATALAEVMAIWLAWAADDAKTRTEFGERLAAQAVAMAGAIDMSKATMKAPEPKVEEMKTRPVKPGPSPWGNVR